MLGKSADFLASSLADCTFSLVFCYPVFANNPQIKNIIVIVIIIGKLQLW